MIDNDEETDAFFAHHGIKGMKWGVLRDRAVSTAKTAAGSNAAAKVKQAGKAAAGSSATAKAKSAGKAAVNSSAGQKVGSTAKSAGKAAAGTETGKKGVSTAKAIAKSEFHNNYSADQIHTARANVAKKAAAGQKIDNEELRMANTKTAGERAAVAWLTVGIGSHHMSNAMTDKRMTSDTTKKQIKRGQKWIEAGYGS